MREPTFILALMIAATTLILLARTIAGALAARGARSELAKIREQLDHHAAALEDAQSNSAQQAAQLSELQERLDFAERLLAQARDRSALGAAEKRG